MQDDPRSHGLWEKTAPPPPDAPALRGHLKADVVVIGAGYTGLSAALHLAQAGADVVVLESVDIGFGGSGRNVGLVNAGLWVMPDDVPRILGHHYGERLVDLLGRAPSLVFELIETHGIDCEATRAGTLHCAVGQKGLEELERRVHQWTARGAPVALLDRAETAARVGSTAYEAALLDARAGTIQPLAYARGLARAAVEAGARIFCLSPAESTERTGGRWTLRTPHGTVATDWIVVATNAYTRAPWPEVRAELVRIPYFNFATEPLPESVRQSILPERQGAWDTRLVLSSFRLDRAGRLVVGSFGALRGTGTPVHRAWARRALSRIFPEIGAVKFESEWYGMIGMTGDGVPRLHAFAPRVIGFSGYNGRGIAPGTVFGRVLAHHITGTIAESALPLPFTKPRAQSLRAVREAFYEIGAQVAHLAGARLA